MNRKALRTVLRLASDAESAGCVESYDAELLAAVAAAFPCEVAVFNEFDVAYRPAVDRVPTASCSIAPMLEPAARTRPSPSYCS
jgi:hypothetical protein